MVRGPETIFRLVVVHDPQGQVQRVGTDVDERTAALFVFVQEHAPGRNGTTTDRGRLCIVNVAEGAGQRFALEELGIVSLAALVPDGELLAVALRRVEHLLRFYGIDRHRLFTHDVLASVESVHGDEAVRAVRGQDVYHIDGLVRKQLLIIRVDRRIRRAVVALRLFSPFFDQVAECHHFHIGELFQRGHMLAVCDTAAADDTDTDLVICTDCHRSYLDSLKFVRIPA